MGAKRPISALLLQSVVIILDCYQFTQTLGSLIRIALPARRQDTCTHTRRCAGRKKQTTSLHKTIRCLVNFFFSHFISFTQSVLSYTFTFAHNSQQLIYSSNSSSNKVSLVSNRARFPTRICFRQVRPALQLGLNLLDYRVAVDGRISMDWLVR